MPVRRRDPVPEGALEARLFRLIEREGPITVARYMAEALGHPEYGYYRRTDPLGAAGDFVTAPEISQMFGELIGLWCVDTWRRLGRPSPFVLAELGPGRGTLMSDLLRAAAADPAFTAAARVHLVEISKRLRTRQRAALGGRTVRWHESFADLPAGPLMLVANEFFDALPIRQFVRRGRGWRERLVGAVDGRLAFVEGGEVDPPVRLPDAPEGAVAEVSPEALAIAGALGGRLAATGGAALVVDYGYVRSAPGDTFQAVRAHAPHDVLTAPGTADLTAHVDFARLGAAAAAAGARVFGPVDQGEWLIRLGIEARAARLIAGADAAREAEIRTALHRLIAPAEMGTLFKVLAIAQPACETPAGFEGAATRP